MKSQHIALTILPIILVLLLFAFDPLLAQSPPPPPSKPVQNPVDGGLALLAAAGGVYAVKKLRERE